MIPKYVGSLIRPLVTFRPAGNVAFLGGWSQHVASHTMHNKPFDFIISFALNRSHNQPSVHLCFLSAMTPKGKHSLMSPLLPCLRRAAK